MSVISRDLGGTPVRAGWYSPGTDRLADLIAVVSQRTELDDYPYAHEVVSDVLIYGSRLAEAAGAPDTRAAVQLELTRALLDGPGIVVFREAFDTDVVDGATRVFDQLIRSQKQDAPDAGDHFGRPGENDRVWRALDKLAVADPRTFTRYYANDLLALVSEAWLGPNYRITSQLNVVNPGGRAQVVHRDYHLGIQEAHLYPAQVHAMSMFLTLQGAVAHVDMPVETGPTMYLPYSQQYPAGFVAVHQPDFADYFAHHFVQLALQKGDAVFFNPALFHGAGHNRTSDVRRIANLMQVSSAFGKALEAVDTTSICKAVYPYLSGLRDDTRALANVVTAAAEGYPFPTNLDLDRPGAELAPPSQADLLRRAVAEEWDGADLAAALDAQQVRRRSAFRAG